MKRAYVYFWDGFRFGPRVVTDDRDLLTRLRQAVGSDAQFPSQVSAIFIANDLLNDHKSEVHNAPGARTTGAFVAAAELEEHWPKFRWAEEGKEAMADFPQAGVFVCNILTGDLRITGGLGFSKSEDDCNPRALREMNIQEEEA